LNRNKKPSAPVRNLSHLKPDGHQQILNYLKFKPTGSLNNVYIKLRYRQFKCLIVNDVNL